MDQTKEWIQAFEQTKIGKTLKGKEAFRNKVGRALHGVSWRHRKAAMLGGVAVFVASSLVAPPLAMVSAPALFLSVYAGMSPRKTEKAACDFLMNVAIRKAALLNRFMIKKNVAQDVREAATKRYLEQNLPWGLKETYNKEHPMALRQIMSGNESEAQYHTPEVYVAEIMQELLTRNQEKGGILHGIMYTFTKQYRALRQEAENKAKLRWQDREKWMKLSGEKPTWPAYMKEQNVFHETGKVSLNANFRSLKGTKVPMLPQKPSIKKMHQTYNPRPFENAINDR